MLVPNFRHSSLKKYARAVCRAGILAALVMLGATRPLTRAAEEQEPEKIRLGFSYAMLAGLNENDAKASMRAFAAEIGRERNLPCVPEPRLYAGIDAIEAAAASGEANAIGFTAEEYWVLRRHVRFDALLFAVGLTEPYEAYIIVVPSASPVQTLAELRGRNVTLLTGTRMSLARPWLDVELAKLGLPLSDDFFGRLIESAKPSKVVLPVFFSKAEACIVNRNAFDTMVELNPQIGRQVRVIATSPGFTPALFGFTGLSHEFQSRAVREFSNLHLTPAGQQVLTMFQTRRVGIGSESIMDSAIELLDAHARLCPNESAARVAKIRKSSGLSRAPD